MFYELLVNGAVMLTVQGEQAAAKVLADLLANLIFDILRKGMLGRTIDHDALWIKARMFNGYTCKTLQELADPTIADPTHFHKKITVVKLVRQMLDCGLGEAKMITDMLLDTHMRMVSCPKEGSEVINADEKVKLIFLR
jgi:hypothetical protein